MVEFRIPLAEMSINELRSTAKTRGIKASRNWGRRDYVKSLGYNATVNKGRRAGPKSVTYSEDDVLKRRDRKKLVATARDQSRNYSILAWMVRRHIDYVSQFHLMVKTGHPELDAAVKQMFDWHARPRNFDVSGRHGRNEAMRLFEAGKVLDGDCGFIKLETGQLQAVESDLIAKPSGEMPKDLMDRVSDHGLVLDDYGKALEYVVCKRNGNASEYQQTVEASNMLFDGYFSRFGQTRGISPLSTALNTMADLYEGFEWTLLKIKFHAFLGMAIYRDETDTDGFEVTGSAGSDMDESGAESSEPSYDIQLKKGLMTLDLDPGDKVDLLESKTPASPVIDYSGLMIRTALLALDIPYTAFDSMKSSFSARIADRVEYEESASQKRRKNQYILEDYADWKLSTWANMTKEQDDVGSLMKKFGVSLPGLRRAVEWVPHGTPWLDKYNEVQGDQLAISIGLDSAPQAARRRGKDAYKVIDEQAEFLEYARSKGVPIAQGQPGQATVEQIRRDEQEQPAQDG